MAHRYVVRLQLLLSPHLLLQSQPKKSGNLTNVCAQGVPINSVVALLVEEEGEEPDLSVAEAAPAEAPTPTPEAPAPAATPAAAPSTTASGSSKPLSPAVLALVNMYGLDVSAIPASGPKGHILKGDVLAYIGDTPPAVVSPSSPLPNPPATAATQSAPVASEGAETEAKYTDIPVSTMRRVIAERLTESKSTIPHAYTQIDVDVTELLALRTQLLEEQGAKFSVNDAIIKASALALRTVPAVNANFVDGEAVPMSTVDISVAVATPNGLITPIVPAADGRSVFSISSTIKVCGVHRKSHSCLEVTCSLPLTLLYHFSLHHRSSLDVPAKEL